MPHKLHMELHLLLDDWAWHYIVNARMIGAFALVAYPARRGAWA
jgi:hypothetical protein